MSIQQYATNNNVASTNVKSSIDSLTLWKKTACKIAILAPSLFFSTSGWIIGFVHGGCIGGGLGNGIGTFVGGGISIAIEIFIRTVILKEKIDKKQFIKTELNKLTINSLSAISAGFVFNLSITTWAAKAPALLLRSICTGIAAAIATICSLILIRGAYTIGNLIFEKIKNHELFLNMYIILEDIKSSLFTTVSEDTCLYVTSYNISRTNYLKCGDFIKAGISKYIGGISGLVLEIIITYTALYIVDKLTKYCKKEGQFITKYSQYYQEYLPIEYLPI